METTTTATTRRNNRNQSATVAPDYSTEKACQFIGASIKTMAIVAWYVQKHGVSKASSAFSADLIRLFTSLDSAIPAFNLDGTEVTTNLTARTYYNRFKQAVSEYRNKRNAKPVSDEKRVLSLLKQVIGFDGIIPDELRQGIETFLTDNGIEI